MYSVMKKNIANSEPPTMNPTAFAPVSVRLRKMLNGTSGASERRSMDHLGAAKLEHVGQTLAALPNLRAELARMQIATDAQGAFLHRVAWKMEHPGPDTLLAVLESKAAANEAALDVTDRAMR